MTKMTVINLPKDEWIRRCKVRVMQRAQMPEEDALEVAKACYDFVEEAGELTVIPPEQAADEEMSEWSDDEPSV